MENKNCQSCQEIKPLDGFHKNPKHPGGYHRYCKECRKKESQIRYVRHREKLNRYSLAWARSHPIKRRTIIERYRCKSKGIQGNVLSIDWREVLTKQNFICNGCLKRKNLEMDHIVSIKSGGTHTKENIQGLCHTCNNKKGRW